MSVEEKGTVRESAADGGADCESSKKSGFVAGKGAMVEYLGE